MKNPISIVMIVFAIIFLVVGLFTGGGFGIVTLVMNRSIDAYEEQFDSFKKDAEKCKGVIISSYDSNTVISYEDDEGEEYEVSFSMSSSSLRSGKKVDVYYDSDDHSECMIPEVESGVLKTLSTVFGVIAIAVSAVLGGIAIILFIAAGVLNSKLKAGESVNNNSGINKDLY